MDIVLFFVISLLLFSLTIFIISKGKIKISEKILNTFSELDLGKIEIKLSETSYSGLSQFGGITRNAILYYGRNLLIFTPSKKYIFNRLYNNLPIILVSDNSNNLSKEFDYKKIENIIVNERIILVCSDSSFVKRKVEFSIFSENENLKLKEIIMEFKANNK
jgi:hypothetical protein